MIVVGAGGVGCAATFHLAQRGLRVLALDWLPVGHDQGSSHGQTRIIRLAYYEHPDYVPLLCRAYQLWQQLEELAGEVLYRPVGLLQLGAPDGAVISGVWASSQRHQLPIEKLEGEALHRRFPQFAADGLVGLYEANAGFLMVENCTRAHARLASERGADIREGVRVLNWRHEHGRFRVETDCGDFEAPRLVITAGAWAGSLVSSVRRKLEVRRKVAYWFQSRPAYRADAGCPCFLFDLPGGIFYGIPAVDGLGVKVAEHTGGDIVANPSSVDRSEVPTETERIESFVTQHLPALSPVRTSCSVCMYTMSPDGHFIVDRHPAAPGLVFAAGLSGHGYKFASVLGEILADLVTETPLRQPIDFLSLGRFSGDLEQRGR